VSGTKSTRFFWSDWESDESLKMCSLAAQGLWMRMLCIMAKSDPPGHLMIGGKPLDVEDMRMILGPRKTIGFNLVSIWKELEKHSVFSRNLDGIIINRRMIRDAKRSEMGRQFAKQKGQVPENTNETSNTPTGSFVGMPMGAPPGGPNGDPQGRSGIPQEDTSSYTFTKTNDSESLTPFRPVDDLVKRLFKAAGPNVLYGTPAIEMIKPILDLQAQGCNFELDILPAVQATVPKLSEPLRTWSAGFLRDAIMAKRAARLRSQNGHASTESDELRWRKMWDWWKRSGDWPIVWGPDPTCLAGCEIPKELIERWSAET
jgi:hypothetical protein